MAEAFVPVSALHSLLFRGIANSAPMRAESFRGVWFVSSFTETGSLSDADDGSVTGDDVSDLLL